MSFTDEDLNRIKEIIEHPHHDDVLGDAHTIMDLAPALLARLEAAEAVIFRTIELDDSISLGSSSTCEAHNNMVEIVRQAMDVWEKAAGR